MKKLTSLILLSKKTQNHNTQNLKPFHSLSNLLQKPTKTQISPHFVTSPSSSSSSIPKINGFFSNPILVKHFFSTTHFKGSIKTTLVGPTLSFIKTHFPKAKPSSSQRRKWSSWTQGYSTDNVVLGLILANTAVFVLWKVMDRRFMYKNFTISVDNFKSGRIHTVITSAFSHMDMGHLISNMIGLYFFGNNIGRVFGPEYLLKLYLAGAVVGSAFFLVHHAFFANMNTKQGTFSRNSSNVPGLGASGAVNAILLLDIFLFPKATLYFDFFIPVPAILLGIFLVGQDVLRIIEGDPQISGSAHLGGAVVAAVAWLRLRRGFRF